MPLLRRLLVLTRPLRGCTLPYTSRCAGCILPYILLRTLNIDKVDKKTEICPICQRFPIKTLTKLTLFKNFVQFVKFGSKIEAFFPGNLRIC